MRFRELRHIELLLEVGLPGEPIHYREQPVLLLGQELLHLRLFPAIELSFLVFGVGVDSRVESAVLVGHFTQDAVAQLLTDAAKIFAPGQTVGFRINAGELAVVVEHFFKMRNPPEAVGAVAMKAAAEVIADSPHLHFFQRGDEHPFRLFVLTPLDAVDEVGQVARLREFGTVVVHFAVAKAAPFFVELGGQLLLHGFIELFVNWRQDRGPLGFQFRLGVFDDGLAILADAVGCFFPDLVDSLHQGEKAGGGAAVAVAGGEVRAAEDRLRLGGQKHAHRPTPAAAGAGELVVDLQGGHVDAVDVRPLFAVHLDADEMLVEVGRNLVVQKRLPLHHMAPVATGIAHREKNQFPLLLRLGQRLVPPGIPVHRVVGMLQQIRARLLRQAVRRFGFGGAGGLGLFLGWLLGPFQGRFGWLGCRVIGKGRRRGDQQSRENGVCVDRLAGYGGDKDTHGNFQVVRVQS